MGYYTRFELSIKSGDRQTDFEEIVSKYVDFNPFDETCKWYDCEKDMREISKLYPETVFQLEGEGEESGDIWKAYFKNGLMQKSEAIITFEEFDENKLV